MKDISRQCKACTIPARREVRKDYTNQTMLFKKTYILVAVSPFAYCGEGIVPVDT